MLYSNRKSGIVFSLKLLTLFVLAKLTLFHFWLTDEIKNNLPIGWNFRMFWTAFISGGRRMYFDYPCFFKTPSFLQLKEVIVEDEFKLKEEDILFFYKNGYLGPFNLMPANEVEALCEYLIDSASNTESKIHSRKDYEFEKIDSEAENQESIKFAIERMNLYNRHLEEPKILNLFKSKAIVDRCAQLLGPYLILWKTAFFNINPFQEGTRWHQASTFLMENTVEPLLYPPDTDELFQLTCWIALTDATVDNGCVRVIPGSQKAIWPLKINQISQGMNNIYGSHEGTIDYPIKSSDAHAIEVKAGQFFLFTERVIHGSLPNKTNKTRWGLNGRIIKPDTKCYSKRILEGNHNYPVFKIKNWKMDNWKAVLIRGKDRYGYNKM